MNARRIVRTDFDELVNAAIVQIAALASELEGLRRTDDRARAAGAPCLPDATRARLDALLGAGDPLPGLWS